MTYLSGALVAVGSLLSSDPGANPYADVLILVSSHSCTPKKTCTKIGSCEEARWLLANCSWGGKLDRDHDGVPCEDICPGG